MHHLRSVFCDPGALVLPADDEPGDVLEKNERDPAQVAKLDEVGRLERRFGEQNAVVGDEANQKPVQTRKSCDERCAVPLLELVEARAIDDSRDDFPYVVRLSEVGVDDAVNLGRVVFRILWRRHVCREPLGRIHRRHHRATQRERVFVVFREIVGDPGKPRVHVGAAEFLGGDLFARGRLDERRTAQKNRSRTFDDDRFVRHRRHVRSARGTRAHHDRDLRNPFGRHPRLIEKNTAEVLAIGKHLGLQGQEGAARIDQIHARQPVLEGNLLRAHVFFDGRRVIGAAFHRGVVGDKERLTSRDAADPGNESRRRRLIVVHVDGRERRQFEKG